MRLADVELDHPDGPRVLALRKGRREREAMLVGPIAAESLRRWLEVRGTSRPDAPLFCRLHALQDAETVGPLSSEAVRQMLRQRAKQAGVRAIVRPHGLRHSAATHCARNSTLTALKRLGGWTTLSSPARYLDRDDRDRRTALAVVEC